MLIIVFGHWRKLGIFFGLFVVVLDVVVNFVHSVFKRLDALADATHQFGNFFAAKEEQYHDNDDNKFGSSQAKQKG